MTVQQFLDQDRKPEEILVIDQSESHSPRTAEFLERLHRSGDIRLIRQEEPNPCRARNMGIREAKSEIVLIVDDDILIRRDFVRRHLLNYSGRSFEPIAKPSPPPSPFQGEGVPSPRRGEGQGEEFRSGHGTGRDRPLVAVNGAIWWERGSNLTPLERIPDWMLHHPFGWTHIPATLTVRTDVSILRTGNCSILRSAALAVGGLDECFGPASLHGDLDFGRKLVLAGGRIVQDPTAGIYHLRAPSGGNRLLRRHPHLPVKEEVQSLIYFYLKHYQGWHSWKAISELFRIWVANRRNVTHPHWLPMAAFIYARAFVGAAADLRHRKDLSVLSASVT